MFPTGEEDYVFYRSGGLSWAIPYVAGLYALACQVDPEITPWTFWRTALATGDFVRGQSGGRVLRFGKVVNPAALMAKLQR